LTDTVGFINKLPTLVIAAFRATLEEIDEATVLVHVLDVTHPNAREHMTTVNEVLEELGVDDKPVIVALNKVDRAGLAGVPTVNELKEQLELDGPSVAISAQEKLGFDELRSAISTAIDLEREVRTVQVRIPYNRTELVERFYRVATVSEQDHDETGTLLHGRIAARHLEPYRQYLIHEEPAVIVPSTGVSAA
jgi:GTPase